VQQTATEDIRLYGKYRIFSLMNFLPVHFFMAFMSASFILFISVTSSKTIKLDRRATAFLTSALCHVSKYSFAMKTVLKIREA